MTEPDRKDRYSRERHLVFDGHHGTPCGAVCLGVMYAEPGVPVVGKAAAALKEFWMSAAAVGSGSLKPWMSSVTIVLKCLGTKDLTEVCVSPWVCCPLPRWLTV